MQRERHDVDGRVGKRGEADERRADSGGSLPSRSFYALCEPRSLTLVLHTFSRVRGYMHVWTGPVGDAMELGGGYQIYHFLLLFFSN